MLRRRRFVGPVLGFGLGLDQILVETAEVACQAAVFVFQGARLFFVLLGVRGLAVTRVPALRPSNCNV